MGRAPSEAELRFVAGRRVGHLATVNAAGHPSVVPFCYALIGEGAGCVIVSPLDEKPKRVPPAELARAKNLQGNSHVDVVVDDYDEDWSRLAWVKISGTARLAESDDTLHSAAVVALRAKYTQYEHMAIDRRPLIVVEGLRGSSWGLERASESETRPSELAAIVQGRRSVRVLRPDPIPRPLIEQAISAAGWAPSPHGRQPWRFAVIESSDRKQALVDAMAQEWERQLQFDGQDAAIVAIRLAKSRERLLTAPVIIVPCLYLEDLDDYPDRDRQIAETTMAVQSLGAAIQNFLLTTYASGLDTGWMCAPLFCPDVVRDAMGLDKTLIPQALLPVGYAAKDPVRRPRMPLDKLIVQWS